MDTGWVSAFYWVGVATNPASACQLAALLLSASGPLRGGPEASLQRLGPAPYGVSHEGRAEVGVAGRALRWLGAAPAWTKSWR